MQASWRDENITPPKKPNTPPPKKNPPKKTPRTHQSYFLLINTFQVFLQECGTGPTLPYLPALWRSNSFRGQESAQGNLNWLRSTNHLDAPAEKTPDKIYSSLVPLPIVQANVQRFLSPVLTVLSTQLIPYLKLILTSETMKMTFLSLPAPSCERGPFLAQQ